MTDLRQAAQQALEALIDAANVLSAPMFADAADALRKALAQPEQEPVAYYHPHKGFHWAKPTHISAPTVVDVPPMPLYAAPPAAQPPPEWVGLTEEELRFYRKKYSKLFNAGYDKVTETNLIAEEFDSIGFYKEVSAVLKERNT